MLLQGLPAAAQQLEEALSGDVAPTFAQATCRVEDGGCGAWGGGWDGMGMGGMNLDDFGAVFDMSLIFDKSAHFWEAEFWP